MRFYEVWDQRSRNLLGSFGAEPEALALVRDLEAESGPVDALSLVWGDEDDDDLGGQIAQGAALLRRAHEPTSHSA
jgi:hypothetical protein